jgi:recombination protein RecA
MRYGEGPVEPVATFPSGSVALDLALGTGGVPRAGWWRSSGRSSGKTTLSRR